MSQAKRPGPPRARHLGGQSCEDVSGETARTTSRTASWSPLLRGCLRRNAQSRTTQKREFRGCLRRNGQNHNILLRTSRRDRPSAGTSFYHNRTPSAQLFGRNNKTQLVSTWRPLAPSTKQHECQTDVLLRALNANVLRVNASSLAMATGSAILLPAPYVRVDSVFI